MDISTEKFLFSTRFDDPHETAADPEVAARERERTALIDEGRRAGVAEAQAEAGQMTAAALDRLPDALSKVASARDAVAESTVTEAAALATLIVKKAMPGLTAKHGTDEIVALIENCLHDLVTEPRIVVRLADPVLDQVRERLDPMVEKAGFTGDVVLLADPDIAGGDCRVEWADGGAERDGPALWSDIDAAAERLVSRLSREPDGTDAGAKPPDGNPPGAETPETGQPEPETNETDTVQQETE